MLHDNSTFRLTKRNEVLPTSCEAFLTGTLKTRIPILFVARCLLTGCLTSPNPFYTDAQVFQDDRILGDYRDPKTQEGTLVERDMDHEGRYMIRCFEGTNGAYWIRYVGTLFKLGDVPYLDLYPQTDSGVYHDPGGPPTGIEILRGITYQRLHSLIRVAISDQGIAYSVLSGQNLRKLIERDRSVDQYVRGAGMLLPMQTAELQKLLQPSKPGESFFPEPKEFQKPRPWR